VVPDLWEPTAHLGPSDRGSGHHGVLSVSSDHPAGAEAAMNHALFSAADVTRFWSKVDDSGGPDTCWPYVGAIDKDGYGKFQIKPDRKQRHYRAHRVAFALARGKVPVNLVTHRCDFPPCCHPEHLVDATQLQNRAECKARGRTAKGATHGWAVHPESRRFGETHPRATVTDAIVWEIRDLIKLGWPDRMIGQGFGVSRQVVAFIRRGRTWRHLI
jgi:hypothetical protein